jgi:hypothetical protein
MSHVLVYKGESWGALLEKMHVYSHAIVWKSCFHQFIILRQLEDLFTADLTVSKATFRATLKRICMEPIHHVTENPRIQLESAPFPIQECSPDILGKWGCEGRRSKHISREDMN